MNTLGLIQRIDELREENEAQYRYTRNAYYEGIVDILDQLKSEIMPDVGYDELRNKIMGGYSEKP